MTPSRSSASDEQELQPLLEFIHQARGFDFRGYKRTTLRRRIEKRMAAVGASTFMEYRDHLEANPDEFTDLFDTILINVTGFFRDSAAWDYVASDLVPALLDELPPRAPLRVWCAGCASGEEAYTTAIVLAEALGEAEFGARVKIYATDVDEDALARARHAVYSNDALKSVSRELIDRYFEPNRGGRVFRSDLRRAVIFGHHDLVQDAPISRIDLLVSRNALMYFTAEAQARILERFNFALKETGFLFLGKSEMLITHTSLFRPYDLKRRVFRKVPGTRLRESLAQLGPALVPGDLASGITRTGELRTEAGQLAPTAQIVVDRGGFLVEANQRARQLFDIAPADLGRPFHELELSYRPVDLRSGLDELYKSEREVALGRVEWRVDGDARVLEVKLTPVPLSGGQALGCSITFEDVTELARLNEAYEQRKRELERAYEELQSTVEELETTNEELMSTNEELETTNEELQSTNEELETMNEELQSTNDELETMNQEHVDRSRELDQINIFFEGILASLGVGVIVIGRDRKIQVWNAESGEFWGLRPEEAIGARLEDLDIGLPVDKLDAPISDALAGDGRAGFLSLEAVNRRGRPFHADVRVMPLLEESGASHGALIIVEDRGESRSPVRT